VCKIFKNMLTFCTRMKTNAILKNVNCFIFFIKNNLPQFTFVLTATKSRRTRLTTEIETPKPKFVNGIYKVKEVCCSIDVWGILINIILQVEHTLFIKC